MDFDSNHLVLAVVAVVIFALIRTLIYAGKEINSSDKFPTSKERKNIKKGDDSSLQK
ncbi:MAG: hypothetical protein HOB32_07970 [Nitrospina sp.]|nr:hypothetical protein [Nitrospina sp.]MBT6601578.1 hypothetical protein [Nitrospina sp.]